MKAAGLNTVQQSAVSCPIENSPMRVTRPMNHINESVTAPLPRRKKANEEEHPMHYALANPAQLNHRLHCLPP